MTSKYTQGIKTMIRPVFRRVFRPIIRPAIGNIAQAVQRYFTTLSAAAGQHYELSNDILLTGDFVIKTKVMISEHANTMIFSGGTNSNGFELFYSGAARNLSYRYNGLNPGGSTVGDILNLNVLTEITITRVGSLVTMQIPSKQDYTVALGGDLRISILAGRVAASTFYLSGIIADFKVWDNGVLIVDMPLDENWVSSAVARNKAFVPTRLSLTDYTHGINGGIEVLNIASNEVTVQAINKSVGYPRVNVNCLEVGKTYFIKAKCDLSNANNDAFVSINDALEDRLNFYIGNSVTKSAILVAGRTDIRFYINESTTALVLNDPVTFSDIEIYEISASTPLATSINITSADAERYTQSTEFGGWVSNTELVTQAVWEPPVNNAQTGWTYDAGDNTWNLVGDGSLQALQLFSFNSQPVFSYLDSTVLAISGGSMVFQASNSPRTATEAGRYQMVIDTDGNTKAQQYKRGTGSITAKLAKPSFRKFLPLGAA